MNLSLPELIEITKDLEDMVASALRQRYRRHVVFQVLAKGVPVSTLLRLIPAYGRRRSRRALGRFFLFLTRHGSLQEKEENSFVFLEGEKGEGGERIIGVQYRNMKITS